MTLRDYLTRFVDYYKVRKPDTDTWANYQYMAGKLVTWLENTGEGLTPASIQDLTTEELRRGVSKNSLNTYLKAWKAFVKFVSARENTTFDMSVFAPFRDADVENRRVLTDDELEAARWGARRIGPVAVDMLDTFANTGLRAEEYTILRYDDLGATHLHLRRGKGGKPRDIPANDALRAIWQRNRRGDVLYHVAKLSHRSSAGKVCRKIAREARIPVFGPHAVRHWFATYLIKQGVPIKLVSEILGHASVAITEKLYCHIEKSDTTGVTSVINLGKLGPGRAI